MNKQEFRTLIREEIRKVLTEAYYVQPESTIGDILANGKRAARGDIAKWTWTSIPTLNSRNWKGMNQTKKFTPIIKQMEKYSKENVVDFFGKKVYTKLEKLQSSLTHPGFDIKPNQLATVFDKIYDLVYSTLQSKK
jgi:hypothetical protein